MFAPTKVWRRWHRKVNLNEKRTACCSAFEASALTPLVMARGHKVDTVPELPLVVENKALQNLDKASKAVALLKSLHAYPDVERVLESQKIRVGVGKSRNRRYVQRRGPLVVYNEKGPFLRALRNIPGVELVNVNKLSVLCLAPGGHLGRFIIFTKDAFQQLDSVFGTLRKDSVTKKGFRVPRGMLNNADIGRIINSEEVQSHLRAKKPHSVVFKRKKNPYSNFQFQVKLNPYAKTLKRGRILAAKRIANKKSGATDAKKKGVKPAAKKTPVRTLNKVYTKALLA